MTKQTIKVDITTNDDSTVEITGSLPWETLVTYKEKALERAVKEVEVDGFRKGNAPKEKVEQHVGSMQLLSEAAQDLLGDTYSTIVIENEIKIIGAPDIAITKLAEDNPLEYKITTAVFPKITLGDYKKIASKSSQEEVTVEEKEIEESIEQILNMNAKTVAEGEEKSDEKPELTDEFVKTLGEFKDVAEFKEKLQENIMMEKTRAAQAKAREDMMRQIIDTSEVQVPELLITSEQDKMVAQMKDDVMRMGLEYNEYLKHMGKTEEELKDGWKEDAELRAKSELILKEIASTEDIKPDDQKVNQQIEMIKEQYGDSVSEQNIRLYVESLFINEAVLVWLEEKRS